MTWPESQVQAVNGPVPKTWEDYRQGCVGTFSGGHDGKECSAFRHGMETVFNLLEHEFPPAEQCKKVAAYREAVEAMVRWFDAESQNLGTFHDMMDLCKYTEWAARKAIGEDVGEYAGVPRLLIVPIAGDNP